MKVSSNKISDIYSYYLNLLEVEYSPFEGGILLKRLMGYYLNVQSFKIPQHIENERVVESMLLKIHFAVKELLKHKPLEYIIQTADFYEMKFSVNQHVLIPRPETEELVDLIWKTSSQFKSNPRIIDIGTGSGCIAISLNKLIKSETIAVDVSKPALDLATKNKVLNHAEVQFIQMNFLEEQQWNKLTGLFDVIVSNPPYIRELEKSLMKENVLLYEPKEALFVKDNDPLIFYKAISSFGQNYLKPNGYIYVEINEFLGKETADIFKKNYSKVATIKDLNGKDRFIIVQK